jgi:tetratricopeptide (TPR) repeat protein
MLPALRCLVVASVLLLCAPSFAQTAPASAAVSAQARASFARGMEAYDQGHFRAAIEHFKEADRLAPSPRLSFNVALAYERMDDVPNALAAYRDFLRRSPEAENVQPTSVRVAELELELQKSGVQQVTVLSDPMGATVLIDELSRGVTPWTGELPPGPHRLTLRARNHRDNVQDFVLPARHAIDLSFPLEALPASPLPATVALAPAPIATAAPVPPVELAGMEPEPAVRWWTWTAFGASAAALIGAGAFEISRRHLESQASRRSSTEDTVDAWDQMLHQRTLSRVFLGTGLALGAVGGVSLYLDLQREGAGPGVGLACGPNQCGAFARGYW